MSEQLPREIIPGFVKETAVEDLVNYAETVARSDDDLMRLTDTIDTVLGGDYIVSTDSDQVTFRHNFIQGDKRHTYGMRITYHARTMLIVREMSTDTWKVGEVTMHEADKLFIDPKSYSLYAHMRTVSRHQLLAEMSATRLPSSKKMRDIKIRAKYNGEPVL